MLVETDLVETLVALAVAVVAVVAAETVIKLPEHKILLRHRQHNHKYYQMFKDMRVVQGHQRPEVAAVVLAVLAVMQVAHNGVVPVGAE